MDFRLRGTRLSITPDDVRRAMRYVLPNPTDGRNKYFVELHGERFPIRQVFEAVSGFPSPRFTSQDAHRVLSRLGFDIIEPPAPRPVAAVPARLGEAASPGMPGRREVTSRDESDVRRLLVVFETDEDGWEVASCPALPGCHSQGRTREEALENIREAIRGYLASLREHGVAPPTSSEFRVIDVRVPR